MKTKVVSKEASWLNKYQGRIDLEPFFQREVVWNNAKQQYFIDSVVKCWGTPKIYLWDQGDDTYACVDGKQRLTSLFKFMADDLRLGDKSGPMKNKKYSELSVSAQDSFDKYKFSVELLSNASQDEIAELYRRLQGGTALNFGERLYGEVSKINDYVKKLSGKRVFFKKKVAVSKTRYSHYAVCAQLCLLSVKGASIDLKINNIKAFFSEYGSFDNKGAEAKKIEQTFTFLEKSFQVDADPALRNRANIVSIFYLASYLASLGKISGKEKVIGDFFRGFVENLQKELLKDPDKRDSALLSYQQAVTQGADKIKSIKIRHDILVKALAEDDPFFHELLFPVLSPRERFSSMYEQIRIKLGLGSVTDFESWLIANESLPVKKCTTARGKETYLGHIRNCINHSEHGKYTPSELKKGIHFLVALQKKLN